jgi:hypothetical protein
LAAAARVVGIVSISLGCLATLVIAAFALWLRTSSGAAWLAREASDRLGLTLTVGRISGSLIRDVRLEDVALHDARGRLVARADVVSAHYHLRDLIRRHEVEQLGVVRPVVARFPARTPSAAPPHGTPAAFSVNDLTITGATFEARGHGKWADGRLTVRLESLDRGALHAHGSIDGPLDALDLELTALVTAPKHSAEVQAGGKLRHGVLVVTLLQARTGATKLTGVAQVDARHVDASLSARVAPAEAAVVGISPAAPIRLRVAMHGPPRAVALRVDGRLRAAHVALRGRVDFVARRGRVRFMAHGVRIAEIVRKAPKLTVSGAFAFDGAVRAHRLDGELSVAEGRLRIADLSFDRLRGTSRVQLGMPGEANVIALSGRLRGTRPRQVATQTVVRWDRRSLRCDPSHAVLDENEAAGQVVYTRDPLTRQPLVTVAARRLSVSPALVQETLHHRPSRAWPGRARFVWTPRESRLAFALDTGQGPASGVARLRRNRGVLELPSVDLTLDGSRLRGAARVKRGEIVAAVDELLLQPRHIRRLSPLLEPARDLRIQGAVAGPLHALDIRMLVTAGGSTAQLGGRVDAPARSFRLVAAFDTFFLQSIKATRTSRINLELSLSGRLVEGGVAGTLTIRRASGTIESLPLQAARADATLDGPRFNIKQVLVGVPGAVLQGEGGGTYRDFRIKYGVVITDALKLKRVPTSLRLMIGLTSLTPGRSVVGTVQRHAGGKIQLTHRVIPPPFRVANLLFHLLSGHPLHLSVH